MFARDRERFQRWLEADPTLCCITNKAGETLLMAATQRKLNDFAKQLLERGATLDALSALRLGRMNEFRQLLADGPRPIPTYWLFEAVRFKRLPALRALAEAGGDVQAADEEGHSLLYRADIAQQAPTADWLSKQGVRETIFDAVSRGNTNAIDEFLKGDPGQINATNRQGRTLLFAAIAATNQALAEYLLDRGAKFDTHTPEGWTPLHLAASKNLTDIGSALLARRADPNEFAAAGMAPLHIAAAYGSAEFCTLLLERGAEVNLRPSAASASFGNAPLLWAAHKGGPAVVRVLLEHGADPKVKNRSGATAATLTSRPQSLFMAFPAPWEASMGRQRMLDATEQAEILRLLGSEAEARK
jgi:ankyrin repeat protein